MKGGTTKDIKDKIQDSNGHPGMRLAAALSCTGSVLIDLGS